METTIRRALDHVWYDGISRDLARQLLRRGGWANGERLAGQEVPALAALAGGAGPDAEIEVDDADAEG